MNAKPAITVLVLTVTAIYASPAIAQEPLEPFSESMPLHAAACDMSPARLHRAGNPYCPAPWARFTYNKKYCGYFVGGGAALYGCPDKLHGEPRYPHEGTWGMDYQPWFTRVRLQWFHGTRKQDGEGQYEPDGLNNPLSPLIFR